MVVRLSPALRYYLWGGSKLKEHWGKTTPRLPLAECWELSLRPDGASVIDEGAFAGCSLRDMLLRSDWGGNCARFPRFPALIKLIDARENLSVQVHPPDGYALARQGEYGKTELWHILEAQEGAVIYLGLKQALTRAQFFRAVSEGVILDYMNVIPVKPGESYWIPAGTLHALGAGVTLAEIQQNSDLTYRVYDYDRRDAEGRPRALHLEEALDVVSLERFSAYPRRDGGRIARCPYFTCYLDDRSQSLCNQDSFIAILTIAGTVRIDNHLLQRGQTAFLSAGESVDLLSCGKYLLVQLEC